MTIMDKIQRSGGGAGSGGCGCSGSGSGGNVSRFHQASWNEPVIFELDNPGYRGIEVADPDPEIEKAVGKASALIPAGLARKKGPALPRISQARVLRHYLRISQETLGADLNAEIGQGTCTMKYSPTVNERIAATSKLLELHPLQREDSVQGILEIMYRTQRILCGVSGMDEACLQPQSGSQALLAMASMIRARQDLLGHPEKDELITTVFSHPSAAASAIVKGFKVKTVRPLDSGYPDYSHLQALVGPRTAGFIAANPEDTGLYNGDIRRFTDLIHQNGGFCGYDQANANGLFGVVRARESGFDMCFFNLHKSFSTPHGCGGPGTGAVACTGEMAPFLPLPRVTLRGDGKYALSYEDDGGASIGKVRMFHGVAPVAVKAYSWVMSLGAEGLREVAMIATLNNNYLFKRVLDIPGFSAPFPECEQRVEQARYSLEGLFDETGVTSEDVGLRMADFGFHYWTSHHPFIVPQPMTLEPTESASKEDLDEYADTLAHIAQEARSDPKTVKSAPHNSTVHRNVESPLDDPEQWCITWRMYCNRAKSAGG